MSVREEHQQTNQLCGSKQHTHIAKKQHAKQHMPTAFWKRNDKVARRRQADRRKSFVNPVSWLVGGNERTNHRVSRKVNGTTINQNVNIAQIVQRRSKPQMNAAHDAINQTQLRSPKNNGFQRYQTTISITTTFWNDQKEYKAQPEDHTPPRT